MDRQLEKLLASAGREVPASKAIMEINPAHDLIKKVAELGEVDRAFREDIARLLLDEALIADGERPQDARGFSQRLQRLMARGLTVASS